MNIIFSEPSKEALETNGWEPWRNASSYVKRIRNCTVYVQASYCESLWECLIQNEEILMPNDLIAIGTELKKLEEN